MRSSFRTLRGRSEGVADGMGHDVSVNLNVYTQTSIDSRLEAAQTLSALVN